MIVFAAALLALSGFLAGFSQFSAAGSGATAGLAVGVGSAVAWAVASVFINSLWSSWFNLFAAVFAAASLGYVTPGDALCRRSESPVTGALVWQGHGLLLTLPCWTRPMDPPTAQDVVYNNMAVRYNEMVDRIEELAQAQRALGAVLSDLGVRVHRLEAARPSAGATQSPKPDEPAPQAH